MFIYNFKQILSYENIRVHCYVEDQDSSLPLGNPQLKKELSEVISTINGSLENTENYFNKDYRKNFITE